MSKEQRFLDALKDIFVGVPIEGESGYINLMQTKTKYFQYGVFPKLMAEIDSATEVFPEFREELFDRLYAFFSRYFSECGSIYYRFTPFHERLYEQVYTDDYDVMLFWKTQMLYYVKTDRLFHSMETEVDGFRFFFDASNVEHKKANERRSLVYEFNSLRNDGALVFTMTYSERGRKTNLNQIRKAIKDMLGLSRYTDAIPSEKTLERAFGVFERQSEVDYFINKDARRFLQQQFDLWLYQYIFEPEQRTGTIWKEKRIRQLQVLKDIACKIIDFIAQFEDELVKIWNKPKFVLNSHYVITLNRIAAQEGGLDLLQRLLEHPGMKAQIQEWNDLGMVPEQFDAVDIWETNLFGERLNSRFRYLPLDTRFFADLETAILGLFDYLDQALDGWLVNSENYQALNSLKDKFRGQCQCIYIDPPFNLEEDADYSYKVKYKDSTWATLLENRISAAHDLLSNTGMIFVRCDHNGNHIVRSILDRIFGKANFRNEIILNRFKKSSDGLTNTTESLFFYSMTEEASINQIQKPRECIFCQTKIEPEWQWSHSAGESTIPKYFEVNGERVLLYPPRGRHWTNSQERIDEMQKQGRIRINFGQSYTDCNGKRIDYIPEKLQDSNVIVDNNWTDIPGYEFGVYSKEKFSTQNAEVLLKRVVALSSQDNDIVLDFFAGSATTQAVAHKLGRRWMAVEMGDHFYSVMLPRMKRVLAYDPSGISQDEDVKEIYSENSAGGFSSIID